MAKLLKKQISDVNISENFCIFVTISAHQGQKVQKTALFKSHAR